MILFLFWCIFIHAKFDFSKLNPFNRNKRGRNLNKSVETIEEKKEVPDLIDEMIQKRDEDIEAAKDETAKTLSNISRFDVASTVKNNNVNNMSITSYQSFSGSSSLAGNQSLNAFKCINDQFIQKNAVQASKNRLSDALYGRIPPLRPDPEDNEFDPTCIHCLEQS